MREIKFRAKNKDGKWYYSDQCGLDLFFALILSQNLEPQEYTGLKDKNSKEIYEGDIVQFDKDNPSVKPKPTLPIFYDCGAFMVGEYTVILLSTVAHVVEVIGNIYDNPEILKK